MEQWVLLRKGGDFQAASEKFQISPRLACLIRNREVWGEAQMEQYLNGSLADLHDGMRMRDMDRAVDILREKIEEGKKIRVIGDYDIDGVNAAYILLEGLERLGADVDSDIPDRIRDGYGLNVELVERAYQEDVDTILTCDNGIAAAEEIRYGKQLGMTMIVTDHHEVPYEELDGEKRYRLPPGDAVIDPKRADCDYPFSGLCGAAVAYKLMEALFEASGRDSEELDDLIVNVAVATVGDVMDLIDENRIFVKEGLAMLGRSQNPGLNALIECTGLDKTRISAYHVGFVLGPCLNAGGRLDTAKRSLALLRTRTRKEAAVLAGDLKALNDSRKEMTEKAVEEACRQIEETGLLEDKVLAVYLPDCHESLAGIVAGRLRERYWRPVFVLTDGEEGVKGSGRSIEAYSMYEELSRCAGLLTRFGGHKLAAGLSLKKENIEPLRRLLNENCRLEEADLMEKVVIDMELPFSYVTETFVEELKILEPFGKGNTKPVFAAKEITLSAPKVLGKNRNVLKMQAEDARGTRIEAMYFGGIEKFQECLDEKYGAGSAEKFLTGSGPEIRLMITYYPGINEYMGRKSLQIVITHCQ